MAIYWTMFVLPLLAGMSSLRPSEAMKRFLYVFVFVLFVAMIGGRNVIGCDWNTYLGHYYHSAGESLFEALDRGYPGYSLLNWVATHTGLPVHAVNTACGAIFAFGLLRFASRQPFPWLIILAAIPYMVIVVSMGFTRQATALGFIMLAFNAFVDRKLVPYLVLVGLAGLFHSSSVAFAPLAVFIRRDRTMSPLLIGGAASAFLLVTILSSSIDKYVSAYIEQDYQAEGALYRTPLNAIAAVAMLLYRRRWFARYEDGRLFVILALISLAILPLAFTFTVVADRMSIYLLPFQVAVAARLPALVTPKFRTITTLGVAVAYGASLYVWLTFANHAHCWVPYSSIYF